MSTWLDDLKRKNPALAADYAIVGNQSRDDLKRMRRALESFGGFFNTEEDNKRLAAAKRILRATSKKAS